MAYDLTLIDVADEVPEVQYIPCPCYSRVSNQSASERLFLVPREATASELYCARRAIYQVRQCQLGEETT